MLTRNWVIAVPKLVPITFATCSVACSPGTPNSPAATDYKVSSENQFCCRISRFIIENYRSNLDSLECCIVIYLLHLHHKFHHFVRQQFYVQFLLAHRFHMFVNNFLNQSIDSIHNLLLDIKTKQLKILFAYTLIIKNKNQ